MVDYDYPSGLFLDPTRASRTLTAIHEAFIQSGSRYTLEQFSAALRAQVPSSPDPGMALNNLLRFCEATVSKASLFSDLVQYPIAFEVLMRVFGSSQYFADIIIREPGLFRWLTTSDALSIPVARPLLLAEVDRLRKTFTTPERRLDALKRIHRRELLRIGTQDLLGLTSVEAATAQLSELADGIVDAVLEISALQLTRRFGKGPGIPFAVIGLGKLGGRELNYSSDIDVLFVYEEEGEYDPGDGGTVSFHEYFVRLAEKAVQNLSQPTAEGHCYRVDTRLRPEAGAGPLARSRTGYLTYYESRGELWERQMLIKGRPIAGDRDFGARFLHDLEPFVYPRSVLQHPAESIARIKARIEAAVGDDQNIKLMRGGIRDIEFVVQAFQMLHGGNIRSVRETGTLPAIEALVSAQLLLPGDAAILREAYLFFRTLEHRLQIFLNTQTHLVPTHEAELVNLSRRMGLATSAELLRRLERYRKGVREIFDAFVGPGAEGDTMAGTTDRGIAAILEGGLSDEEAQKILADHGFRDSRLAARHVRGLATGSSLSTARERDTQATAALRLVATDLFAEIAATPDPDLTLANLAIIGAAQRFPEQLFGQLGQAGFRSFLLNICAVSARCARGLAADPLLLESLAADVGALAAPVGDDQGRIDDPVRWKQQQELRSAIRFLLDFIAEEDLGRELSAIGRRIVTNVAEEESQRARIRSGELGIFALGKFGTEELTFDADLDLLFVVDGESSPDTGRLETLAQRILKRLTASTAAGRLYDVDARLRPEGKNAPLVVDTNAYARYLSTRASLWERQALTRLRPVCGAPGLVRTVTRMVGDFVLQSPLPAGWSAQIVAMRRKTESRSRVSASGFVDVKLGAGGMADVEFAVQAVQLAACRADLLGLPVHAILSQPGLPGLTGEDARTLADSYRLLRRVERLLRLVLEDRGSILPEGEPLERLARFTDAGNGRTLLDTVRATMRRTRTTFLAVCESLSRAPRT
jgi:[glutamine synthetase] adenylyltransferase / [glutamine synthetase]-adenylyl-L-tyrosine phosphorylase